jgi:ubiquinone/menaquinone biosynthesis C-methylase UbiE
MPSRDLARGDSLDAELLAVREFWEEHVQDWQVADCPIGTAGFFREIEAYRFEKLQYLLERVDFGGHAGQRLLEVGCGLGNDLARFAQGGARTVGIDLAGSAIDLARVNFRQRGLEGEFHVMNGEAMEFPDASFDVVYCHTVLQFTARPERMIHEIHRVLKPGGVAILMTINRFSWLNLLRRVMRVEIDHLDAPVYRRHTRSEFRLLLAPFERHRIIVERFPVATKVHSGLKARLYNAFFVRVFNAAPRSLVAWSGHHLIAYAWSGEDRVEVHPFDRR